MLSENCKQKIDAWLKKYPPEHKRSGVLQALHYAQEENEGWLSETLLNDVAEYLELPNIYVYEIANFYSLFELKPVGKYKLSICNNISCMLCGSEKIIEHLEKRLSVKMGETTSDGLFSLRKVECLAACAFGPVLQVNDKKYCEQLTPDKVDVILDELRQEATNG